MVCFAVAASVSLAAPVLAQNIAKGGIAVPSMGANTNHQHPLQPIPPSLSAKAWVAYDISANQVLGFKNIDLEVEPASLTKLMTAYVVFQSLASNETRLSDKFTVSQSAWEKEGSRMFVPLGGKVAVEDLIKGMIVQSGNDAANVLAEGVAGSVEQFVVRMNQTAKTLGMSKTTFRNVEGLPAEGHVSTVRDLATLARRLIQDFPQYTPYYAIKHYAYPGTPSSNDTNRNALLFSDPTVDGLKTGHTDSAGYNLIATAKRPAPGIGDRRVLTVVVGTDSQEIRAAESEMLINWAYQAFDVLKFTEKAQTLTQARVWKGTSDQVNLGLPQAILVAIPAGSNTKTTTTVVHSHDLSAPIKKGQAIASMHIDVAGQRYHTVALQAMEDIHAKNWFGRLLDTLKMWLQGIF